MWITCLLEVKCNRALTVHRGQAETVQCGVESSLEVQRGPACDPGLQYYFPHCLSTALFSWVKAHSFVLICKKINGAQILPALFCKWGNWDTGTWGVKAKWLLYFIEIVPCSLTVTWLQPPAKCLLRCLCEQHRENRETSLMVLPGMARVEKQSLAKEDKKYIKTGNEL